MRMLISLPPFITLFSSHSLLYSWSEADVFTSSCVQLQHGRIHLSLHVVCVCTRMCVYIYSISLDCLQRHTAVQCLIKFEQRCGVCMHVYCASIRIAVEVQSECLCQLTAQHKHISEEMNAREQIENVQMLKYDRQFCNIGKCRNHW